MLMSAACVALAVAGSSQQDLRVMVWNVLRGANEVDRGPEKTLQIIREHDVDLVLLQESYDINGERPRLGEWLAGELGWTHHQAESKHLCVLTPLEIDSTFFHHEWHGVGARIRDAMGRSFLAWSIWIDWRAFITYALRDDPDMTDQALIECETVGSNRMAQAEAILKHLHDSGQMEADIPLLVGGDWNCPSHLDWTADTARIYRHRRNLSLPVSMSVQAAGLTDTYRTIHPNPVQHPGITWSPMDRNKGDDGTVAEQCFERIDRLYLKNPLKPAGGWSLRPKSALILPVVWEDAAIPSSAREFPSDHAAVIIDLSWSQSDSAAAAKDPEVSTSQNED